MQSPEFESLLLSRNLDDLSEQSWTLCNNFLSRSFFELLLAESLLREKDSVAFRKSEIGKGIKKHHNSAIRGDDISWIDFTEIGLSPPLWQSQLAGLLDQLKMELNQKLFLGLDSYECHFASYPPGAFYQSHIDQGHRLNPFDSERVISFIFYLNPDWKSQSGGELLIEMPNAEAIKIPPLMQNLILFRSDTVPHAVLETKIVRRSLTGWFRKTRVS